MGFLNKMFKIVAEAVVDVSDYQDEPDVFTMPDCPECGERLHFSYNKEQFKCSNCGNVFDMDDLDLDDEDGDGIPAGCARCGGPYPSCMSGCNLYND